MSEWRTVRIGDVAAVFDGPHATPTKVASGPIFLGISSLESGRLKLSATEHLSETDFAQWTRRVLPTAGDVVFSYETRLGEAALIPNGLRCCLGRRMGLVRPRTHALDSRFFLYQYLSPGFQEYLRSRTIHGSTVDRIPLKAFPDFPLALPALHTQRHIAHILGTLDDKIELNRRTNETLEAMARAIFQSWFVGFEFVRVSASELIREKVLDIGDGYRAKNDELGDEGLPFIRAMNLKNDFDTAGADRLKPDRIAGALSKCSRVGDVAFTSKGTIGRFARVGEATESFVYSPQVCFWRTLDPQRLHPAILYCWMQSVDFLTQLHGRSGETDMAPYVSLRDQRAMFMPRFDASQAQVGREIAALLSLVSENQTQSRTLSALRDALLPRLLSGEICGYAASYGVQGMAAC
ncbi:restriction endonuclease subunit S [Candidatus Accumulibacter phosphatis]|jgi:type I restriction enzyme S subunit|uniref:Restriction endonuclease subunit S n=1 Tax=Candidatus Accumulibacter phosphatis TaxID=327160 RepID=A0ABX1U218_9PROT|nr:restriction endonuclease subunit S [Candidatus Accumulibacter phosphatis]NMQ29050.1 restriction endonuclease subunit S [Candidatus Accumulibacter phosphatis]